jgi:putative Mg2+ transporter-C (MgtC) family protein
MDRIGYWLGCWGGFYYGAILATFLILLTLITFNKLEWFILKKKFLQPLHIGSQRYPRPIG